MTYRRYGYKAPHNNEAGAHDTYAISRFLFFVLSFVMFMLSYIYSSDFLFGHYFLSGLLFILVGFSQEFLKKFKNIPVLITALLLMFFADTWQKQWFTCTITFVDEFGYQRSKKEFVIETYYIYIFYNLLIAVLSFIDNKSRNLRSRLPYFLETNLNKA